MLDLFKDFLTYSKSERNGIIVLLFIIFLLMLVPAFLPLIYKPDVPDFTQFKKEILEYEKQLSQKETKVEKEKITNLFAFNPNNLPEDDWLKLGLNKKVIRTIKNYVSKGGKFYKKEDLKKVYGLNSREYNRLEPYILIPKSKFKKKPRAKKTIEQKEHITQSRDYIYQERKRRTVKLELNSVDSLGLIQVYGIGPVMSRRIMRYRRILGGFRDANQLVEVYGFDTLLLQSVYVNFLVDTSLISRLNLNSADKKQFSNHPYIDYNLANAVVNYRSQHGDFKSVEELKNIFIIDSETYNRIVHYVKVDP